MFDIINNYHEEVLELDILEKYVTYVVEKLKLEKAIFNFILVDEEEIHELLVDKELNNEERVIQSIFILELI